MSALEKYDDALLDAVAEYVRDLGRAYYEVNKKAIAKRRSQHYAENRDEYRARAKVRDGAYYAANREKELERGRAYREANREKVRERHRVYREAAKKALTTAT